MSDVENTSKNQNVEIDESAKKPLNRRQFLIKGATYSAPVIMTVAASPVLANHCSVSGALSGNLSRPGDDDHICVGLTPGYWGQHPREWNQLGFFAGECEDGWSGNHCSHNEYKDNGTPFDSGLGGPFDDSRFGDETMMQVIQKGGNDDMYQLGAHACAALLNATKFENDGDPYTEFGYTPQQIIDMYNARYSIDPEQLKIEFQLLNERSYDT